MKKLILSISILLAVSGICRADFVGEDQVKSIASRWLGTDDLSLSLNSEGTMYFVNSAEGGWVIISAEDSATPIIGYSDEGSIDLKQVPPHAKYFLGVYDREIKEARELGLTPDQTMKANWKMAGLRTKSSSGVLNKTANWGQESPYNLNCPQVTENGKKYTAVTGCVATTMAILCRYYEWPEYGNGTVGGYSYTSEYRVKITVDAFSIDDHHYDYSLMPLTYNLTATSSQKNAVAQLMFDLGAAIQCEYNYNAGTGAVGEDIPGVLYEHFGYSGEAKVIYRYTCSDAEFLRPIKAEIDAGHVVPYGGVDSSDGGHQFLCDGYDSRDYIHINWGWDGQLNGYFTLKLNIPSDSTFDEYQSIAVGVVPDKTSSSKNNGGPIYFIQESQFPGYKGLTISSGSLESKSFKLKAGPFFNADTYRDYDGAIRIALVNYKGDLKEVISSEYTKSLEPNELTALSNVSCKINSEYAPGDKIVAQYKEGEDWHTVYCWEEVSNFSYGISVIDLPYIAIESSYSVGDSFLLDLVPGTAQISSFSWTFDGASQSHISVSPLTAGTHEIVATVKTADSKTYTIKQRIVVN